MSYSHRPVSAIRTRGSLSADDLASLVDIRDRNEEALLERKIRRATDAVNQLITAVHVQRAFDRIGRSKP